MRFQMTTLLIALLLSTSIATAQPPAKPLDPDVAALVKGNNEFAFDLYRQLSKKEGNIFFSPVSISTTLAIIYAGARGSTAKEMAKTLHFDENQENVHRLFSHLIADLEKNTRTTSNRLDLANALWVQDKLPIEPSFFRSINDHYRGMFHSVDFARNPVVAQDRINQWVNDKTQGRIRDILGRADIDSGTQMYVTNAVSFDGFWAEPFPSKATKENYFHLDPKKTVWTPFMNLKKAMFNISGSENFGILEIPYQELRTSMFIMLPKETKNLSELEKNLTLLELEKLLENRKNIKMDQVSIPKFSISAEYRLSESLKSMGMKSCFSSTADFSGIARGNLCLQNVIHKTRVDVDEKGTYASAVTASGARLINGGESHFNANRPFIFLVRDNMTGSILFMGRVAHPKMQN